MQSVYAIMDPKDDAALEKIGKAFSSATRIAMMRALRHEQLTVTELGKALGLTNSTVLFHLKILEEAGLILVYYLPGKKGFAQTIALNFDYLTAQFDKQEFVKQFFVEQSIPVGMYVDAEFFENARIATDEVPIIRLDKNDAFNSVRTKAQLLWTTGGRVTYAFSNNFAKEHTVSEVRLSLEICSETSFYRNDWKSDVTFAVNDTELCTWTCPGDYGGTRGRLNPDWWANSGTQYGDLVTMTVNERGTFLNNMPAGNTTLSDLKLDESDRLLVSVYNKKDALYMGGFNIFGEKFGNYEQDIILTAVCEKK